MNTILKNFLLILASICLKMGQSVSVMIDPNSIYRFSSKITKAETFLQTGKQFLMVLFENGTISALDNNYDFKYRIETQDKKKIVDFQIINTLLFTQNTLSLIVIMENRTEWRVISLLDRSWQVSSIDHNLRYEGLLKIFPLGAYMDDRSNFCVLRTNNSVEGWFPEPEIQIGNGDLYSDFITNNKVVELAGFTNGCINQIIRDIQPGIYELVFYHAARRGATFIDCMFSVHFDGKLLKQYLHANYSVNRQKIEIQVTNMTNSSLRFCSFGGVDNNRIGALLINVSLVQKAPSPTNSEPTGNVSSPTSAAPSPSLAYPNLIINGNFEKSTCTRIVSFRAYFVYADIFRYEVISRGAFTSSSIRNFTNFWPAGRQLGRRQIISKAAKTKFQSQDYIIFLTEAFKVYSLNLSNWNFTYFYQVNSTTLAPDLIIDKQIIALPLFTNNRIEGQDMSRKTAIVMPSNLPINLTESPLRGVRPRYDSEGQRFFIYDTFTVKVNLTANTNSYSYMSDVQNNFTFSANGSLNFVTFASSPKSFVYKQNDNIIYGYCESLLNDSCMNTETQLSCSQKFVNCQVCDDTINACSSCVTGYLLINNTCMQSIRTVCAVQSCAQCYLNNTCLKCLDSFVLNEVNNSCVFYGQANFSDLFVSTPNQTNSSTQTHSNPINNEIQSLSQRDVSPPQNINKDQTVNSSSIDSSENSKPFEKERIQNRLESYSPIVKNLISLSSFINSSPVYRTIFRFMSPLFALFEDYWFYIYHNNSWQNFNFFPDTLICMYLANQEKILPSYLTISDSFSLTYFQRSQYFTNYTNQRILAIDQQETYTEQKFEDLIFQQFPQTILALLFIKLLTLGLKYNITKEEPDEILNVSGVKGEETSVNGCRLQIQDSQIKSYLKVILAIFEDWISFQSILLTLFGSNLFYVSFTLSAQLKLFFMFTFADSANLIIAIFLGFIFIHLFICLLALTSTVTSKIQLLKIESPQIRQQKIIGKKSPQSINLNSVIFHGIKLVLNGFIHGFFIDQNAVQYIFLILVKFGIILFIAVKIQSFQKRSIGILTFIYYLMGILIDLLFYLEKTQWLPEKILSSTLFQGCSLINFIQLLLLAGIAASIFFTIMIQFFYEIKNIACLKVQKNQKPNKMSFENLLYYTSNRKVMPFSSGLQDSKIISLPNVDKENDKKSSKRTILFHKSDFWQRKNFENSTNLNGSQNFDQKMQFGTFNFKSLRLKKKNKQLIQTQRQNLTVCCLKIPEVISAPMFKAAILDELMNHEHGNISKINKSKISIKENKQFKSMNKVQNNTKHHNKEKIMLMKKRRLDKEIQRKEILKEFGNLKKQTSSSILY